MKSNAHLSLVVSPYSMSIKHSYASHLSVLVMVSVGVKTPSEHKGNLVVSVQYEHQVTSTTKQATFYHLGVKKSECTITLRR